jgi:DNA-directed RNA polymerase subunit H (RpoH/RPB5)
LKKEDAEDLLSKFNISLTQLPKIASDDPGLPEGCEKGDLVKIERKLEQGIDEYYRVVI